MAEIIYENECKQIYGLLFKIQNDLGTNLQEKHYQKAFEALLIKNQISYKKEVSIELVYNGKSLGKFFADFVINNKIIVEFKTTDRLTNEHLKQMLRYLQTTNLKLGLVVNFRKRPLKPMRVLNSQFA
ncbi:MAG: GTP-binding signal recognition particle [Parcubacteria group bacterium LiPW_39]|nr:MAG: GTP-binding signal recognition particle [Parcubacteria group bacterium LiPW_39]